MTALLVLVFFIAAISISILFAKRKEAAFSDEPETVTDYAVFSNDSILVPQGFYFSKGHTWLNVEKDGEVKLGIDDFLSKILKNFHLVACVNEGQNVKKGQKIFELKYNNKVVSIKSPIDGVIKSLNTEVLENPKKLSENPYEIGWLLQIEPDNLKESLSFLNIGKDVVNWMRDEVTRFKDFLGSIVSQPKLVGVTMYDGGNITEGVLHYIDQENLKNFEEQFLNQ